MLLEYDGRVPTLSQTSEPPILAKLPAMTGRPVGPRPPRAPRSHRAASKRRHSCSKAIKLSNVAARPETLASRFGPCLRATFDQEATENIAALGLCWCSIMQAVLFSDAAVLCTSWCVAREGAGRRFDARRGHVTRLQIPELANVNPLRRNSTSLHVHVLAMKMHCDAFATAVLGACDRMLGACPSVHARLLWLARWTCFGMIICPPTSR